MVRRQKQGRGLMATVGKKGQSAIAAHVADETTFYTGGNLPEGIDAGIAELIDCRFDTYKKGDNEGEYFFLAAGIVKEPATIGRILIRGLRTQSM